MRDPALHDWPGLCRRTLSASPQDVPTHVLEHTESGPLGSLGKVGLFKDDVCGLASELQRYRLEIALGSCYSDATAGGRRSSECNLVSLAWLCIDVLTLSMLGWRESASPVMAPRPLTRLKTPAGYPASATSSANLRVDRGVCSAALNTIAHPAARAGAIFLTSLDTRHRPLRPHAPAHHQKGVVPGNDLGHDAAG